MSRVYLLLLFVLADRLKYYDSYVDENTQDDRCHETVNAVLRVSIVDFDYSSNVLDVALVSLRRIVT